MADKIKPMSKKEKDLVAECQELEKQVMALLDRIQAGDVPDKRALALGRTNIEQGFMWLAKGVRKPVRVPRKQEQAKRPKVKKANLDA